MAVNVAARRRVVIDVATTASLFDDTLSSVGGESGVEPSYGSASEGNGGNAFPVASGIPIAPVEVEIVCRDGGALSVPRADGGAEMRWRYVGESSDKWRGNAWDLTHRVGYTSEVVATRVPHGGGNEDIFAYPDGVVMQTGRVVVAAQRRSNSSFPSNNAVDVFWRDSTSLAWTAVPNVVSGFTGLRAPQVIIRPDGRLLLYYLALNDAGTGFQLASAFSTDAGESWQFLTSQASDVDDFASTVTKLTVVYANGYFVSVVDDGIGTSVKWLYSIDGGTSFKQVAEVAPTAGGVLHPTVLPLIDDTLLFAYVANDGVNDIVRVMRVAAGLDYPDIDTADYTTVGSYTLGAVADLVMYMGNDGVPYVVVMDTSTAPDKWKVMRGSMDGTSWVSVQSTYGLFNINRGSAAAVDVPARGLCVVPYQGTFAALWINKGVAPSSKVVVEEMSIHWSVGSGNENISVSWPWQWSWGLGCGTPEGAGAGMTFGGSATVVAAAFTASPVAISLVGDGSGGAYWESNADAGTLTNANRSAVGTAAFQLDPGMTNTTSNKCGIRVVGCNGVDGREIILRLTSAGWLLVDKDAVVVASGNIDNTVWTEYMLGVTAGTAANEVKYSLVARQWNAGAGDRLWMRLSKGEFVPGSGATAVVTGFVSYGTLGSLSVGESYRMVPGSFCLDVGAVSWADGSGDGLFESGTSSVRRGSVMGAIPVLLVEGFYASFVGDVASQGDEYAISTRYQNAGGNCAPGEDGEWQTASDLVEHYITIDYGAAATLPPWDFLGVSGTNYRYLKVRMSGGPTFAAYDEYTLDATVLSDTACTGIPVPSGSTTCTSVTVAGAGWRHNQWVGRHFVWTSGAKSGVAGRVVQNTDETITVGDATDTWHAGIVGATFALYADRAFYASDAVVAPKRYCRLLIEAQGTPDGKYRTKFFIRGPSHRFSTNWEWEAAERRAAGVETIESPGGQRYVYGLTDAPRREQDVEWTGAQHDVFAELLGLWNAGRGGQVVVGLVVDVEGGPDSFMPARVVGDLTATTQALYVQADGSATPVLAVVDVGSMTFSEELK